MTRKIIIDCDPGQDDAVALFLAFASPELDVLGITTVGGNVPLNLTHRNTRMMCDIAGSDVPVFAGCDKPMQRPLKTAEYIHGETGINGIDVFEPQTPLQDKHGVDFIIETLLAAEDDSITLVPTGPLTNIGTAIDREPAILQKIERIVLMGGAMREGGNRTPSAEFGPAVTNCITPLYVATESAMPLVVLGGSAFSNTRGIGGFQELDQVSAAKPVCKWTGQVDSTERVGEWIHLALGKALEGRPGGVYLDFPGEVTARRIDEETVSLRDAPEITAPHPDPNAIARVADLLESAERPLMLIGKGAAWADAGPAHRRNWSISASPTSARRWAAGRFPMIIANFANAARSQALKGRRCRGDARRPLQLDLRHGPTLRAGRQDHPHRCRSRRNSIRAHRSNSASPPTRAAAAESTGRRPLGSPAEKCRLGLADRPTGAGQAQRGQRQLPCSPTTPFRSIPYRVVAEVRDALPRDAIVTAEGETIMGICRAMLPSYANRGRLNAGTTGCMGVGAPVRGRLQPRLPRPTLAWASSATTPSAPPPWWSKPRRVSAPNPCSSSSTMKGSRAT